MYRNHMDPRPRFREDMLFAGVTSLRLAQL